ncbi:MAG: UDP-N-acetylmuramate dehydrogenase [Bacteroidales bacterium]|nr:UDP-N-acetylmuramate dehydrogenase [Bacteroidales bacterium]
MITRTPSYNLSSRNTFRMKVKCALYVEVTEEADLPALDWDSLPQPVFVMGGGSNLLFRGDFPGTVLHIGIKTDFGRGVILSGTPGPSKPASEALRATLAGRGVTDEMTPRPEVTIGAGTVFDDFCAWAASENLWGPENLSLIPGECGASAVQNIGAYGVEAKDIIASIHAWDTQEHKFVDIDPADCQYGYRTSRFKTEWKGRYVITSVTYRLSKEPNPILDYGGVRKAIEESCGGILSQTCGHPRPHKREGPIEDGRGRSEAETVWEGISPQLIRDTIIGIRRKKLPDPEEIGSAGSFFCNPVISKEHFERIVKTAKEDNGEDYEVPHYVVGDQIKVPAAWMIEQCGFKGAKLGGAQVYQNQPLVIVNATGSATPEEIVGLEQRIIDTIASKYGITLHPEVEHIN